MTAEQNGTHDVPTLERDLAERRAQLAATIDELLARSRPQEVARRSARTAKEKVGGAVRTPEGQIRVERVLAIAAAVAVSVTVMVVARRRTR